MNEGMIKVRDKLRKILLKLNMKTMGKLKHILVKQQKYGDERILELAQLLVNEVRANGYKPGSADMPVHFWITQHKNTRLAVDGLSHTWKVVPKDYFLKTEN